MSLPVKMNLSAPNLVNICVDSREGEDCRGRLYCRYTKEKIPFQSEYHLLKLMEGLMDRIGYPQASVEMRSYKKKERFQDEPLPRMLEGEEIFQKRGELATFLVHVQYRQHATWQGEAAWVEQGCVKPFRSALELLKLMDNVC